MDYLKKSKLFYVLVIFILISVVWFQLRESQLLSDLLTIVLRTLLVPSIVSIFIYYLLKPFYQFLYQRVPIKGLCILASFLVLFLVFYLVGNQLVPLFNRQFQSLAQLFPQLVIEFEERLVSVGIIEIDEVNDYLAVVNTSLAELVDYFFTGVMSGTTALVGLISSSFFIVSLVPIFVYYLLANIGTVKRVPKVIPQKYHTLSLDFFREIEQALSNYITKKALVCFYVFIGAFIVFRLANVPNALLFAFLAGIMDIIPYFGPWIGAFPAILAAAIVSDANVLLVMIGIVIVQLGESYLVSPIVMGKGLKLHPILIIVLMLITGQLFGLIGMIIILPIIAVLKVCVKYILLVTRMQKEVEVSIKKD